MYSRQLQTFVQVAASGSFNSAAEALYVTPTAVMKQINALENSLSVHLFVRTPHGLELTAAGESLLQDARYVIDYCDRAAERARRIGREERSSVRVGVSVMTPAKFVFDIWEDVCRADKDIKVELIPFVNNPINAREILANLGQEIDIVAGLYDENYLSEHGCAASHLYDKPILLAVPVTNPLSGREKINFHDLAGGEVMVIYRGWNRHIDAFRDELIANGVSVRDFENFDLTAYNAAVQANLPIITVEGWEDIHPLLKIVPAEWSHTVPFGLFRPQNPSPAVQKFIRIAQRVLADRA